MQISIRLDVDARVLALSPDLPAALAAKLREILGHAIRTVEHDGHHGHATFDDPVITWSGPGLPALADSARAAADARITRAVVQTARALLAPRPARGAAPAQASIVLERGLAFHATPRQFFALLDSLGTLPDDRHERYFDILDAPQTCAALHLSTTGMMFLDELRALLAQALDRRLGNAGYYYALVWHPLGLQKLIDLDPKALAPLAGTPISRPFAIQGLLEFHEASHLVIGIITLPAVDARSTSIPEPVESKPVRLRDLAPIVDAPDFFQNVGATWTSYLNEWGDDPIEVTVMAFALKKRTHARVLRAIYLAEAQRAANGRYQLGDLVLLTRKAVEDLAPLDLGADSNTTTLALQLADVDVEWQESWQGAFLSAFLPHEPMKVAAAKFRPDGRRLAAKIVAILKDDPYHLEFRLYDALHSAFGSGHGYRGIEESADAFGFFLEQLDLVEPRGTWIGRLYDAADEYYDLVELLVRFGNASFFVKTAPIVRLTTRITDKRAAARDHVYAQGAVKIDGRWWLRPGMNLADGNWLYSARKPGQRLIKEAQAKVGGWMLDAAKTVIKNVIATRRQLTKEEFSKQVVDELQRKITPDDVEQVTIERTLRLIDVREVPDYGVVRHFVRFYWIERVKDEGEWKDAEIVKDANGQPLVVEKEDGDFEELLFMWSYARSSVVLIAFGKGVTYAATFVIAWEAGVFELVPHALGFTAASVIIYLGKAAFFHGDFSIDGLALAAVQGYAGAIGFRIFAPIGDFAGAWLADKIGADSIASIITSYLVETAVAGGIKGAGTAVVTVFLTDVVLVVVGAKDGFSGWRTYFEAMTEGAKWGIVFEFGADALQVVGQQPSFKAVVAAVRRARWSPAKWWQLLDESYAKLGRWLTEVAGDVKDLKLSELLDQFKQEIQTLKGQILDAGQQANLRRILQLSDTELSSLGNAGLAKLVEALDARAVDALVRALAKQPANLATFLEALGGLDENVVAVFANRGQLATLASSSRLLALMRWRTGAATGLLSAFGVDIAAAERFLVELEALPPAARGEAYRIFEGRGPFPSPQLLARALARPGLVRPGLAELVRRIEAAKVPLAALDDLLATLERMTPARVAAITAAELNAFAASAGLRELVATRGEQVAFDLLAAVRGDAAAAERFLARFAHTQPASLDNAISILLRPGNALPSDLVASMVLRHGALSSEQLALLDQLASGQIRASAFSGPRGPALLEFARSWAELTPNAVAKQAWASAERLALSARAPVEIKSDAGRVIGRFQYGSQLELVSRGKPVEIHGGSTIKLAPEVTTTITGTLEDVNRVAVRGEQLPGATLVGENPGGINLLRSPRWGEIQAKHRSILEAGDHQTYWRTVTDEFWDTVNKPWLDEAISRGDQIRFVSDPADEYALFVSEGERFVLDSRGARIRSIFGREVDYLQARGYTFLPDGTAVKPR